MVAGGTGIFLQTGSMSAARDYHTATLLNTGQVLIVGGVNSGGTALDSAELYDPGTGAFSSTTGNLHGARQKHSATLLSDGKVLIAGGIVGAGGATTLATAEIYDPKTGTFTLTGSLARARSEHTATLVTPGLTTDQVLIVSGRDQGGYVPTAELYDPKAGTFTVTSNLPVAVRATHTATRLDNGKVLIAGGFHSGVLSAAELYDPANGTFTATGSLTTARAQQTATLLPGGKVLLVGGTTTLVAELFDPTSGTNGVFTATGSLKVGRIYGHTAALLPNGEVLIAGGLGTIGSPAPVLMEAEFFDLGTGTFTATGTMTAAREHHTATLLVASGKVLIVGGDAGTPFASAELYF